MKRTPSEKELAACYLRLFKSEDGRRVLANLLLKYAPDRPRFYDGEQIDSDPVRAAFRDGQSSVTLEIQLAMEAGKLPAD